MVLGGILGRDDHEGLIQWMGFIVERNLSFAHRLQKTALCFRRRPIDFIGKYDVGENWTRHKFKGLFLTIKYRHPHDIGRKEIARELNALERTVERSRKAMRQRRFSDPRDIFEKKMSARQERDQTHFDHMRFALNHPRNIVLDGSNGFRCIHDGTNVWDIAVESAADRTRSKSNKGSEDGQLFELFTPQRPCTERRLRPEDDAEPV